jgi:hypothetical protein
VLPLVVAGNLFDVQQFADGCIEQIKSLAGFQRNFDPPALRVGQCTAVEVASDHSSQL